MKVEGLTMWTCFVFLLVSASFSWAYRLPNNIIPQQYDLEIVTNLGDENDKFEFCGNVKIQATVVDTAQNITLHSKNLDIDKDAIEINEEKGLVSSTIVDEENDFYTLVLNKALEKDKPVHIYMKFKGKLEDSLAGYYRSSYKDHKTTKYLAVTQFESTDARRAFPCFDEPEMKAKFKLSMGHSKKYTALANMNEIKEEPMKDKEGWVWTRFAETVPMSTYLVAFMLSDFGHEVSDKTHSNVTFRIWARKDSLKQIQFAKEWGPKSLAFFEKFFDVPYPLPKQDMVAIPDFAAGAMENWGLITYRETALLSDPEATSISSQQYISAVIAHELAHQWFGNLVTMKWWTDLWLNEGFATYMSALAVDRLQPEWQYFQEETVRDLMTVFNTDSLKSSHPISVPVGHPREIAEIFDTISYKKGSYILRMMSLFLGEDTLRQGVSKYLMKHRYQNAEQDDLWDSLTKQAHENNALPNNLTVKTIMDSWTLQTGYPVVSVKRNYADGKITVCQKRFLRDVILSKDVPESWWIPLTYTDAKELQFNDTKPKQFLSKESLEIEGPKDPKDFVLYNIQLSGLYRVNYDEDNWQLLINYLNSDKFRNIPIVNRVQLILDSAALSTVGDLSYNIFYELLKYLSMENEYLPWKAALNSLSDIQGHMKRTSEYGIFKTYVKNLLTPVYAKFGRLTDAHSDKDPSAVDIVKKQISIANFACKIGIQDCITDAKNLFNQYKKDPVKNALPRNLRTIIICNALRDGDEEEWDFMWNEYLSTNVATLKPNILRTLGCTTEPWLLRRYLEWSLDPNSGIRGQDFNTVFSAVAHNSNGWYIARDFFEEKIEDIAKHVSPNGRRLSRCLTSLADQMINQHEFDWFESFTKKNEKIFSEARQGVNQGLETIKLNMQWQSMHVKEIGRIISKYY